MKDEYKKLFVAVLECEDVITQSDKGSVEIETTDKWDE